MQKDISAAGAARERSGPRKVEPSSVLTEDGLSCAADWFSEGKLTEPKKIVTSAVAVAETPAEGEMLAETPEEMLAETPETESGVLVAELLTSKEPKEVPGKECTALENGGGEGGVETCAVGKVED